MERLQFPIEEKTTKILQIEMQPVPQSLPKDGTMK